MGTGGPRTTCILLLTALAGCLEPNPNYCPPERCNDAGVDASTTGDAPADAPICLPELLFQRGDLFNHPRVYRVQLGDFVEHQISNGVDDDIDPEWSHDGRRVVVARNGRSIVVIDVETTDAYQVDSTSEPFVVEPAWSSDDSRIAYTALPAGSTGPAAIISAPVNGSGPGKYLTTDADGRGPLDWSPDGTRLAFVSNRTGNLDVFSMAADGTAQTNLTNRTGTDGEGGALWSPDGSRLVFADQGRIWVMNADGSNAVNLSGTSGTDHADPIWSSDGERIYFVANPTAGASLWVMNANGTNQHSIDSSEALDLEPVPSPDGSKIAWSSKRDGNFEIYVSDPDGSIAVRVTNAPDDDKHPRWRPCH